MLIMKLRNKMGYRYLNFFKLIKKYKKIIMNNLWIEIEVLIELYVCWGNKDLFKFIYIVLKKLNWRVFISSNI